MKKYMFALALLATACTEEIHIHLPPPETTDAGVTPAVDAAPAVQLDAYLPTLDQGVEADAMIELQQCSVNEDCPVPENNCQSPTVTRIYYNEYGQCQNNFCQYEYLDLDCAALDVPTPYCQDGIMWYYVAGTGYCKDRDEQAIGCYADLGAVIRCEYGCNAEGTGCDDGVPDVNFDPMGDEDMDGTENQYDCAPLDPNRNYHTREKCEDGIDNDCDDRVDYGDVVDCPQHVVCEEDTDCELLPANSCEHFHVGDDISVQYYRGRCESNLCVYDYQLFGCNNGCAHGRCLNDDEPQCLQNEDCDSNYCVQGVCRHYPDTDRDGLNDNYDNCPFIANDQMDSDHDGIGDACGFQCETSSDCPAHPNPCFPNPGHCNEHNTCEYSQYQYCQSCQVDADCLGNYCTPDGMVVQNISCGENGRCINTGVECPEGTTCSSGECVNINACRVGEIGCNCAEDSACEDSATCYRGKCWPDTDEDLVVDMTDNCPFIDNEDQIDTDHDGIGDSCDRN